MKNFLIVANSKNKNGIKYAKKLETILKENGCKCVGCILTEEKEDLKYKEKLKDSFGADCEIMPSDSIEIGGITGISRSLGLIADETLDSRLQQQKEWFYEHSGLTVTEA